MTYPFLRKRDRGGSHGFNEIVFSENDGYEEAQAFVINFAEKAGLFIVRRCDGPDCWLWDARNRDGNFTFSYDDFPCETTLFAADAKSDSELRFLFQALDRNLGHFQTSRLKTPLV